MLFHRDSGSGVPLLLLHGFTGSGDNWNHVFAETPPGYRVIGTAISFTSRTTSVRNPFASASGEPG